MKDSANVYVEKEFCLKWAMVNKDSKKFWYIWGGLLVMALLGQVLNMFHLSSSYHSFADSSNVCGIHNGLNVLSNLSFIVAGLLACFKFWQNKNTNINSWIVALGAVLVCLGSSYYHYMPSDHTLFWDRLPMSLVFSGILMYSIIELNLIPNVKNKVKFSLGYLLFSLVCVVLWYVGSLNNTSILGPYVFLQFGGMALLLYMGYLAYSRGNKELYKKISGVMLCYIVAKIFESHDSAVYLLTDQLVSGHTIKHMISALALYIWLIPKNAINTYKKNI